MIKSLISAFLMYSRIPMPQIEWKEENRRYALGFFPLVGAVIGGMLILWRCLCNILGFSQCRRVKGKQVQILHDLVTVFAEFCICARR